MDGCQAGDVITRDTNFDPKMFVCVYDQAMLIRS